MAKLPIDSTIYELQKYSRSVFARHLNKKIRLSGSDKKSILCIRLCCNKLIYYGTIVYCSITIELMFTTNPNYRWTVVLIVCTITIITINNSRADNIIATTLSFIVESLQ